jgi:hypothetical protein
MTGKVALQAITAEVLVNHTLIFFVFRMGDHETIVDENVEGMCTTSLHNWDLVIHQTKRESS